MAGAQAAPRRASGVVPSSFGGSKFSEAPATEATEKKNTIQSNQPNVGATKQVVSSTQDAAALKKLRNESPIARIAETCVGVEKLVSEALLEDDAERRLLKFRNLSQRCRNSEDIWFWLGKEYLTQGNLKEAKNCFERVLVLNREHPEAFSFLKKINETTPSTPYGAYQK